MITLKLSQYKYGRTFLFPEVDLLPTALICPEGRGDVHVSFIPDTYLLAEHGLGHFDILSVFPLFV